MVADNIERLTAVIRAVETDNGASCCLCGAWVPALGYRAHARTAAHRAAVLLHHTPDVGTALVELLDAVNAHLAVSRATGDIHGETHRAVEAAYRALPWSIRGPGAEVAR